LRNAGPDTPRLAMQMLPESASMSRVVPIFRAALNILMVALFVLLAVVSYRHFTASRSVCSFSILAVNALFLGLFLSRRPAKSETPRLSLWLLSLTGTALPLLLRPSDGAGFVGTGIVIQVAGIVMVTAGLLSLRRSFAVVPGNRGIRDGGLYRIVRHPIYISELIALLGAVLVSPTATNWIIWLCECGLQFARACAEEDFLAADPVYRTYRERVPYRLLPGLL
jgi:protein-S-isoprenylcysteine O-methyltransferase Ste14